MREYHHRAMYMIERETKEIKENESLTLEKSLFSSVDSVLLRVNWPLMSFHLTINNNRFDIRKNI